MTSTGWHVVLIRCRYEPRIVPFLLALVRVAICFWPQTGYLHPDEFFQSADISGGQYFNSQIQPVWEFNTNKPIRCMLLPSVLNNIAFKLAKLLQNNPSAYILLVTPRLIYTVVTFIIDICLYKLCQYYSSRGLWYLPVSVIFQSSFICLGCLTRTFSNVTEVVIYSLLLVVVCQVIKPRFRILFVTPTRSRPAHERVKTSTQLTSSIFVGILVTLGTFNRPTFLCFALVPMLYWLTESFKRNLYNSSLNVKRVLVPVALSSTITAILLSTYDTIYYNDKQVLQDLFEKLLDYNFKDFYNQLQSKWIFTPYNFIRYNTNVDNLTKYGLHLPYMHMLVNMPIAFNLLGLIFYGKLMSIMIGSGSYRVVFSSHRIYTLMLLSTLTSIILLSFIPHQEFRFLLPLIVPLAYAFAYNIYSSTGLLTFWILSNTCITYFYANIHQAGPIKASLDLDPILKEFASEKAGRNFTLIDVHAYRSYLVPTYHWNIPAGDYRFKFNVQDTFDQFEESIAEKMDITSERRNANLDHKLKLFVMLPSLYIEQFNEFIQNYYKSNFTQLKLIREYTPNFSGEELGVSLNHLRQHGWSSWRKAFGYSLAQTEVIDDESIESYWKASNRS